MNNKRYFPPELLDTFLKKLPKEVKQDILGYSVKGLPIYELKIGRGYQNILMWSQMHGNESTTTKALMDLIPWLLNPEQNQLLDTFTFYMIPQLNPDGAMNFTRLNANDVDLNRDAITLSQPESKVLRLAYERIAPAYALNLHGQRTIYGAGPTGNPATLSFLAPSADLQRSITPARAIAMSCIAAIKKGLEGDLPNGIGRYDDSFNPNCVGDSFTQGGTPTLLFEAGHYPDDYPREKSRKYIFKAYKILFQYLLNQNNINGVKDYMKIPENTTDYVDLMVSNIDIVDKGVTYKNQQLTIQYVEQLTNGVVIFIPKLVAYGTQLTQKAHRYLNLTQTESNESLLFQEDKLIENTGFAKLFSLKS